MASSKDTASAMKVILNSVGKRFNYDWIFRGLNASWNSPNIIAVKGKNGAGKSTLVRIVSGAEAPSGGVVEVFGENIHSGLVTRSRRVDVAYIHQDRALSGDLSIADNIALSVGFAKRFGMINHRETSRKAVEAMKLISIELDPETLVRELSIGQQTLVAIARALASSAKLILLDEPTANLGAEERAGLLESLKKLSSQAVAVAAHVGYEAPLPAQKSCRKIQQVKWYTKKKKGKKKEKKVSV